MMLTIQAKLIALALAAFLCLGGVLYITYLRHEVTTLELQVTALSNSLQVQNDAVTALKTESDARAASLVEAIKVAQQQAKPHQQAAQSNYTAKPTTPDDCSASLNLVNSK